MRLFVPETKKRGQIRRSIIVRHKYILSSVHRDTDDTGTLLIQIRVNDIE